MMFLLKATPAWHLSLLAIGVLTCAASDTGRAQPPQWLTAQPLTEDGDLAERMLDGVQRFLLEQTQRTTTERAQAWQADVVSWAKYQASLQTKRERLAGMLGMVDQRQLPRNVLEQIQVAANSHTAAAAARATWVRWPVLEDPDPQRTIASVTGQGLLLEPPANVAPIADVIVLPDSDMTPCELSGLGEQLAENLTWPSALLKLNCRVLIPLLIDRTEAPRNGRAVLTNREFIYRSSFVLGRHLIGYEVQQLMSAIDWLQATASDSPTATAASRSIAVLGLGEGGRLALFTAALDERVDAVGMIGSFGPMEQLWQEPIDRNVFGLLREFGGAELLSMVAPRRAWVVHAWPEPRRLNSQAGGAPGELLPIPYAVAHAEVERAQQMVKAIEDAELWPVTESRPHGVAPDSPQRDLQRLCVPPHELAQGLLGIEVTDFVAGNAIPLRVEQAINERERQQQLLEELDRHNQLVLRESPFVREKFMSELNTTSLAAYEQSVEKYRDFFRREVIGEFEQPLLPANPRLRQTWQADKWTGYEVVLDVFPDVMAYGALLLPNGVQPGERRPVVVCQHGLEGRPTDTFLNDHQAYHDFAARLCEQGYVVFAPQNLYLQRDRFRSLQRLANPLGKTLFSVIVPQHQQIVDWLQSLPCVAPDRIGFYGLSYGGKSAMRIPALVTDYSLSICSADFNEWVVKNASTRDNFSYVWTGEYEIFEWNLGQTFNYAEMAALICPRPFMVERGHFDGVGTDPWVAFEYAKVRHLYAARLKLGQRTQIEWFDGPHTINGQGTFQFIEQHLGPPLP